jgi:hypothetical protein
MRRKIVSPSTPGPLRLPDLSTPSLRLRAARTGLGTKLRHHTTAAEWVPKLPGLEALVSEHGERRAQLAEAVDALNTLLVRFATQDEQHRDKLAAAARTGKPEPKDDRTPADEQRVQIVAAEERLLAAMEALADLADRVVARVRELEDDLLAKAKEGWAEAQNELRALEAQIVERRTDLFNAEQLARWVKGTADDGALGRQPPRPVAQVAPATWQPREETFRRGLHEVRLDQLAEETRSAAERIALDHEEQRRAHETRMAGVQPLDDAVRFGGSRAAVR